MRLRFQIFRNCRQDRFLVESRWTGVHHLLFTHERFSPPKKILTLILMVLSLENQLLFLFLVVSCHFRRQIQILRKILIYLQKKSSQNGPHKRFLANKLIKIRKEKITDFFSKTAQKGHILWDVFFCKNWTISSIRKFFHLMCGSNLTSYIPPTRLFHLFH